ncbi:MAG: hypothetical protein J5I98_16570 [Phaeodactylibacter sp.]|nr:hypothetical protein [Phaeodactylibacter sp.]
MDIATGTRITVRNEDFLVTEVRKNHDDTHIIEAEGISELVRGKRFVFDTRSDQQIQILDPENTRLQADHETGYRQTKLFLESQFRNAYSTSHKITLAHKCAFDLAHYQLTPTLKGWIVRGLSICDVSGRGRLFIRSRSRSCIGGGGSV